MKQQHDYWTKGSYVAVDKQDSPTVKKADELLDGTDYCIVRVDMLKNLDAPADLADRLAIAEEQYHKIAEELAELKERFNVRN